MADSENLKTYVLAGSVPKKNKTGENAFAEELGVYSQHGTKIIFNEDQPHIKDAVSQTSLPADVPTNIYLACHGNPDSTFIWNKGNQHSYSDLFAALKSRPDGGKNIESLTLGSCYGGSAVTLENLAKGPAGMLVMYTAVPDSPSDDTIGKRLAVVASKGGSATDLFIGMLGAFDASPYLYDHILQNNIHLENALPHTIGICGKPPAIIDLDTKLSDLVQKNVALDQSMVTRVREKFNTANPGLNDNALIATVAQKIAAGQKPEGFEEKRIGYALTAAYLDTSGELAAQVEMAKNHGHKPVPTEYTAIRALGLHGMTAVSHSDELTPLPPAAAATIVADIKR